MKLESYLFTLDLQYLLKSATLVHLKGFVYDTNLIKNNGEEIAYNAFKIKISSRVKMKNLQKTKKMLLNHTQWRNSGLLILECSSNWLFRYFCEFWKDGKLQFIKEKLLSALCYFCKHFTTMYCCRVFRQLKMLV